MKKDSSGESFLKESDLFCSFTGITSKLSNFFEIKNLVKDNFRWYKVRYSLMEEKHAKGADGLREPSRAFRVFEYEKIYS